AAEADLAVCHDAIEHNRHFLAVPGGSGGEALLVAEEALVTLLVAIAEGQPDGGTPPAIALAAVTEPARIEVNQATPGFPISTRPACLRRSAAGAGRR